MKNMKMFPCAQQWPCINHPLARDEVQASRLMKSGSDVLLAGPLFEASPLSASSWIVTNHRCASYYIAVPAAVLESRPRDGNPMMIRLEYSGLESQVGIKDARV